MKNNAIYDLDHVVNDWSHGGSVVLIGNAAHAMPPGMGQGANMGLEDAPELAVFLLVDDPMALLMDDFNAAEGADITKSMNTKQEDCPRC